MSNESKTVTMKMAKASKEDLEKIIDLYRLLDAVMGGNFPPENREDEEWPVFDEFNNDDLGTLHEKIQEVFSPAAMMRVYYAAECALNPNNKLYDPDKDYLAHHPEIQRNKTERDQLLAALKSMRAAVAECRDSELGAMACTGSMAPCEDAMGRLFDADDEAETLIKSIEAGDRL